MVGEIQRWGFAKAYGPVMGMKFKSRDGVGAIYMKLVLCSILARKERGLASPSVAQMAADWGCYRNRILGALKRLEKGKLIIVERRFHRLNNYKVVGDVLQKHLRSSPLKGPVPLEDQSHKGTRTSPISGPEKTTNLVPPGYSLQIKREEKKKIGELLDPVHHRGLQKHLEAIGAITVNTGIDECHAIALRYVKDHPEETLASPPQASPLTGEDKEGAVTREPSQSESEVICVRSGGASDPSSRERLPEEAVVAVRPKMTPEERQAFIDRDRARLKERIFGLKDEARTTADLLSAARTK